MHMHLQELWLFSQERADMTWKWRVVTKDGVRCEQQEVRIERRRASSPEQEARLERRSELASLTPLHRPHALEVK